MIAVDAHAFGVVGHVCVWTVVDFARLVLEAIFVVAAIVAGDAHHLTVLVRQSIDVFVIAYVVQMLLLVSSVVMGERWLTIDGLLILGKTFGFLGSTCQGFVCISLGSIDRFNGHGDMNFAKSLWLLCSRSDHFLAGS